MPRMSTSRHTPPSSAPRSRCRASACALAAGIDHERIAEQNRHGIVTLAIVGQLQVEERARIANWCITEMKRSGERIMAVFGC